ncbi:MAG: hypothetical protein HYX76_09025, partial [Acidobacteria bacterium]|nr:hypothetical protein [Acidobacteriota bacterium]
MALRLAAVALLFAATAWTTPAWAQSVTAEADMTAAYSTDGTRMTATRARIFGESRSGLRFYFEGTWAHVVGPESDAFSTAYPYEGGIRPMEMYAEKIFRPSKYLAGVRVGRYRTPFGIYSRSDHGYVG